ncbi:MAG: IS200/IS605 family accessory protein TnpB-related protein, partial [Bryobacteraceae bacterium]
RGLVVSGQRIERRLAHLDARLDAAIARYSSPELKALQSRKDRGERLNPAEMVQLRQERQQFLKSAVHRVTHGVVERLHAAGVHVLVVGQNKGWKNGAHQTQDKGRAFNRRAHRIPHQLLLEQLRYKLHERGMLLVTTEESYTSKTSFALNEPLKAHASVATPAKTASSETSEARTEATGQGHVRGKPGGTRRRHVFVSPGNVPWGWRRIHADLNGAFNILRKVLSKFQVHRLLCPAHELLWLSHKS